MHTEQNTTACLLPVAVLGKNIWGAGPSSFGREQRLSEITIEPIENLGAGQDSAGEGYMPPGPNIEPPLVQTESH